MKRDTISEPSRPEPLTRAERRQARQAAERRRMPQHGKGMGIMVRNAMLRRTARDERAAGDS